MMQVATHKPEGDTFSTDTWDGYPAERNRLMRFLDEAKVPNTVVLTGDSHQNLVGDLKADFDRPGSPVVGVEFAGTAISSGGGTPQSQATVEKRVADQPHLKWYEGIKRGYMSCTLDRQTYKTDVWAVEDVKSPTSPVTKSTSFVVENGVPGVKRVKPVVARWLVLAQGLSKRDALRQHEPSGDYGFSL